MGLPNITFAALALASSAPALALEINQISESPSPWSYSFTASLSETPVEASSADHFRRYSLRATAGYKMTIPERDWLKNPRLSFSAIYSDEVGYEDNVTNVQNSTLSFSGLGYQVNDTLNLNLPLTAVIPTNRDDRTYKGFQGSINAYPELNWKSPLEGLSLYSTLSLNYNFFEYDTSKGGRSNRAETYGLGAGARYQWNDLSTAVGATNTTIFYTDGSKADDSFSAFVSGSYQFDNHTSYSLTWSNSDRTFGYDGITPNFNFTYADRSLITASVSYTL